ncbi:MAG: type II toxin-antitoxin system RelE/ParE family toxin [Nitrospira sp. SB0677_bin_15]|nr:type II toxin-antitoxin system RelE/ParE family toxin [Nitrospira sp. SB0667_bin_9]MYD31142.1 type II toxin-antitoxin system RelE/ParE family toxin [Nitrospira sp. SB0661_bin_20]MYG40573.1 type II toxin-antitoxin system RelE/ParE family toxin [Nitrospira sp. SB0677_bin_15]MYH01291.1 type II toxin-antitoxin system RelE/ParE family toxin [Nitrospira sp. SB0675_bin_23]MYJ21850.1 type II toxin-antitoxin system RelE/ParE family toxin [Nitrospira sp. SB0673_bin_12]
MGWKIEYDLRVLKDMKKLDKNVQQQILDYFDKYIAPSLNPRRFGKPLKSIFSGLWRYRIGDYRAICRLEDKKLIVLVIRVGHRSRVYKKPV